MNDVAPLLHQIHAKGVVHNDVKIENMVLTDDNVVTLIDFESATVTEHKKLHGTLKYTSPELLREYYFLNRGLKCNIDFELRRRNDFHCLFASLYEKETGTLPYSLDEMRRILSGEKITPIMKAVNHPHLSNLLKLFKVEE
jgi:serine/threonine protein kinase